MSYRYEPGNVYCCDNLTLLAGLEDGCIDLILTSPPYDNLRDYKGYSWDFSSLAHEMYRVLKTGGVLVWVVRDSFVNGSETLNSMRQAVYFVDDCGFRMHQRIIWEKQGMPTKRPKAYLPDFEDMFVLSKREPNTFNPVMKKNKNAGTSLPRGTAGKHGFHYVEGVRVVPDESLLTNVWLIGVGGTKTTRDDIDHSAMFPEELARRHILTWTNPGDLVLDPFAGSGTTLKMAEIHDRRWLGCDISQEYVDIAVNRIRSAQGIEHVYKDGSKQIGLWATENAND